MLNWVLSWFKLLLLHLEPFWLQSLQLEQQSPSQALKNPVDFDFYHLPHVTHWLRNEHTCFPGRNWFIKHQRRQRLGDGVHSKKVLLPSWLLSVWLTWLPSWTLFPSTCDGCVHTTRCVASLMASAWISALTATVISFDATNGLLLQMKKERGEEGGGDERDTKTWDRQNNLEVDKEREMRKHSNKQKVEWSKVQEWHRATAEVKWRDHLSSKQITCLDWWRSRVLLPWHCWLHASASGV